MSKKIPFMPMSLSPLTIGTSHNRNIAVKGLEKDRLIEWMVEILNHSFVLDARDTYIHTFAYIEQLINECRTHRETSRLLRYVPEITTFYTSLPLTEAFAAYDAKYCTSKRTQIGPTFNEVRHILNLAQCMEIGRSLKLISFDGDQTLYSDGGNFEENELLARSIQELLKHHVKVVLITAAGYGLDGKKYAVRLKGLFKSFIAAKLSAEEIGRFYVFGGECNYLMKCEVDDRDDTEVASGVILVPVPIEEWQGDHLHGPKPSKWNQEEITNILDTAESVMNQTVEDLKLRAKILRKERAVGLFPGGDEMAAKFPKGHGSKKLKREALDECVLRILNQLERQRPPITIPYCVFNGGRDAWIDIGNKSVGIQCLQAYFSLEPANCLHVGDQFTLIGNDLAARQVSPTIWITKPQETEKILEHLLKYLGICEVPIKRRLTKDADIPVFDAYSGKFATENK